jgi:hypothetical protein
MALILRKAQGNWPGDWNDDDYDVMSNKVIQARGAFNRGRGTHSEDKTFSIKSLGRNTMQRTLTCAFAAGLFCLCATTANAVMVSQQGLVLDVVSALNETIQVKKGGHGWGRGWGGGRGWGHPGRGRHCPPGHWKKGWC